MQRRDGSGVCEADDLIGFLLDLVSAGSLSEVLSLVVRTASGIVRAHDGLLAVLGTDDSVIEVVEPERRRPSADLARLIRSRVPSAWTEDRRVLSDQPVDGFPGRPETCALSVPIRSRRGFRAHLYVGDKLDGEAFTDHDLALLTSLASIAGAVIDKAQLYEEAQQRELWVALQGEIATALLAGLDIDKVLDSVARGARELTETDVSTVLLYDGTSIFNLRAADGQGLRHLVGASFPAENTISGEVLATGEPVIFSKVTAVDAELEPILSVGGIGNALFVPLVATGRTVGTLAVGRLAGRKPLTQTDFWLLESFASQVSVALEYARARAELERLAVVDDEERIARDLHDTVIQQLFATGMSLQATAQRTTDPRSADRIQGAVDCLDTVIRDIRASVFALRTKNRDGDGIRGALQGVVAQMSASSEATVDLHLDGPVETAIDHEVKQHLIASVREALSNVNRHARASHVDVFVSAGDELVLRVVDDGVGIGEGGQHSGLLNLRARAEGLGGQMRLLRPPTGGTELEWRVPWARRGADRLS